MLFGNFLQFLRKTEGIHGAHVLIERHLRMLGIAGAQLSDLKIAENHELIRGTQLRPASVQFDLAVVEAERGGAGKDWSVAFFSTDTRHSICGDVFNHDSDLFAFDHHGLVVGTDAAALKPRIAEYLVEQGDKLTEMGRAFDGRAGETEILCHLSS